MSQCYSFFFYLCKVVSPEKTHMSKCQKSEFPNKLLLRLCDLLVLKLVLECVILVKGLIPFFVLLVGQHPPKQDFS